MTRTWRTAAGWTLVAALLMPAAAPAQTRVSGINPAPPPEPDLGPLPCEWFDSSVSFLDSAVPRSTVRLRFDVNRDNRRPTRAEYLFPGDGFHVPETRVHQQELNTHAELALNDWFSTFMETPFRWVNPERNDNVYGIGDFHFGAKFAFWNTEHLLTAFQLRVGAHTASRVLAGTGHWSIEPSLLLNYRFLEAFTLEGQAGYWMPIGGTDFEGDIFKYGLGLSYGQRDPEAIQVIPVAEIVGWTVTSGQQVTSPAPGLFLTESAAGDTIVNGCLGVRFTLGAHADIYTGYARCFTGPAWYRDTFRVEFRLVY
jgi:hypothetical protein